MVGFKAYSGIIIMVSILVPIIASLIHYFVIGSKGVALSGSGNGIQRFSLFERILHFIRMLSFLIVAGSGIYLVFFKGTRILGAAHGLGSSLLIIASVITLFIWFKPVLFKKYDGKWLKHLGGYFSKDKISLPAGKFNAGQKIFFWITMVLPLILAFSGGQLEDAKRAHVASDTFLAIHVITGAVFIMLMIAHVYLSFGANKGTWRVLSEGKVSKEWVESHHPNWEVPSNSQSIEA